MIPLAHGIGGRADLPLNAGAAVVGAGLAVAVSAVALVVLRPRPWLSGRPWAVLPRGVTALLDHRGVRALARSAVLAALVLVVAVALAGPDDAAANLAPWAVYAVFWVGLAVVSALLGPVWRVVNPLRTLARVWNRTGGHPLPDGIGVWPAAAWLAAFAWLELVAPFGADPRMLGVLLLGYAVAQLAAAARWGEDWFAHGDGFEVYSTLLGRLSPLARGADGALVLRNPLRGLGEGPAPPGTAAVVVVLIGATVHDGLARSLWWSTLPGTGGVLVGTAALAGAVALVGALYVGATRAVAARAAVPAGAPPDRPAAPALFATTLLPIALGYTVAHYFSFLLVEGQAVPILASDPFGTGLDLLGTRGLAVNPGAAPPWLVATVQINAVVLGHVAATAAAHDLALRAFPRDRARAAQLPLVVAMVALTCLAIVLLTG